MKEIYFTTENIEKKSQEMLSELETQDFHKNIEFNPDKSALLVLDMQEFFINKSSHACVPSAKALIPRIKGLIDAYSDKNLPVILTRHINNQENSGLMSVWWKDIITEESPLSRIISDLYKENNIIINKTQYDAFYKTILSEILKDNNISQLVITGVMTHLCCETTARSAFVNGFEVFFAIDGTATYNEKFHRASVLNLSHGFAVPVLTGKILESLYA